MRASQQCLFRCCEKLPRRFVPLVHYSCLVPSATHSANQITPICKPVLCVLLLHYYHAQMYPFWKIFRGTRMIPLEQSKSATGGRTFVQPAELSRFGLKKSTNVRRR